MMTSNTIVGANYLTQRRGVSPTIPRHEGTSMGEGPVSRQEHADLELLNKEHLNV